MMARVAVSVLTVLTKLLVWNPQCLRDDAELNLAHRCADAAILLLDFKKSELSKLKPESGRRCRRLPGLCTTYSDQFVKYIHTDAMGEHVLDYAGYELKIGKDVRFNGLEVVASTIFHMRNPDSEVNEVGNFVDFAACANLIWNLGHIATQKKKSAIAAIKDFKKRELSKLKPESSRRCRRLPGLCTTYSDQFVKYIHTDAVGEHVHDYAGYEFKIGKDGRSNGLEVVASTIFHTRNPDSEVNEMGNFVDLAVCANSTDTGRTWRTSRPSTSSAESPRGSW